MNVQDFFNQDKIIDLSFFNFENAITAAYYANANLEVQKVNKNYVDFFPVLGNIKNVYFPSVLEQLGVPEDQISQFKSELDKNGKVLIPQILINIDGKERIFSLLSAKTKNKNFEYLNGVQGQFVDRTAEWELRKEREQLYEQSKIDNRIIEEKSKQIELTDVGHDHIEQLLKDSNMLQQDQSLYSSGNLRLLHFIQSSLRAHFLFKKDVDYMVQENQVVLIDENTGRAMPGRRLADGLHQAIEQKENVPIQVESQTLASCTFQNYFRQYEKLSGMTGTASTEAEEFAEIYGLNVVEIPTNEKMIRDDQNDQVYLTEKEKYKAVVKEIETYKEKGNPVLVGTASLESSEMLSGLLKQINIDHQVLNAKNHVLPYSINR